MQALNVTRIALAAALLACICVLAAAIAAAPAAAQSSDEATAGSPLADPEAVVEVAPPAPPPPPSTVPGDEPTGATTPPPPSLPGDESPASTPKPKPPVKAHDIPVEAGTKLAKKFQEDRGYGNAERQSTSLKRREAEQDCVEDRPPVSKMLGIGGVVGVDEGASWNGLVIVIAVVALVIAICAFALRKLRAPSGSTPSRGALETVATVVGIFGAIIGIAVQFVPGIGAEEPIAPEATMKVRDVHARITRGEYAKQTGSRKALRQIDRREVGNVVWLEISLHGYAKKRAVLQYALFDPRAGGPLLPDSETSVPLRIEDRDKQTSFVPIWVGYPKSTKFSAQFRLLEGTPLRVRQIASTDAMRGSRYRYACGYGQRPKPVAG